MRVSFSRSPRRSEAPRVGLSPEDGAVIELALPDHLTAAQWRMAAADAAGMVRLSRDPARLLVDARDCRRLERGVLRQMRAWLRAERPATARVALVLAQPGQRLAARLLLWGTGRARLRVFGTRERAFGWLREKTIRRA